MYIMISLNSVAIYCSLKNQLYFAVLVENMQEHWTEKEKYILKKLSVGLPTCPQILIIFNKKPSGSQNRSDGTHEFFIRTDLGDDKTLMKTTIHKGDNVIDCDNVSDADADDVFDVVDLKP